jgi:thiol-disulfide isomerase/thioredoxin
MNHRALRFAGTALVVIVGVWAGARVYAVLMTARGRAGAVAVPAGEASPANPSDFAALYPETLPAPAKIPEYLPSFSLNDSAGKLTSIALWSGRSLVLNFWATWCAPCRREIPLLQALHDEWGGRDVAVIGIAVDHPEKVAAFANEFKIAYPLLIGDQDALKVAAAFGVETPVFPFTVFTDRRGEVVTLFVGELHRPQADLILSVVRNLNQDTLKLPQARRSIEEGLRALAGNHPS